MKNKILSILIAILSFCLTAFTLTACGGKQSLTGTEISSEVFEVNGDNLFTKVSNSQTSFDFNNSIKLADGATFGVFTDISCREIDRIQSYMVSNLSLGDNTYYFLVSNQNSTPKVYTVTVRRRLNYTVTFKTGEGALIENQTVEEDSFAIKPQSVTTKLGWNTCLDYDLNNPITQNTTVTITYEAKEEMANLNFSSTETTCEITGVKDKTATQIIVPNYVTSIGEKAFYNCTSLQSIVIPNSVISIGEYAFENCTSLTKVNYTGTIDGWASIEFDGYYANPLKNCAGLYINDILQKEIAINAEKINDNAFDGYTLLQSVTIGNNVTSIGDVHFTIALRFKA